MNQIEPLSSRTAPQHNRPDSQPEPSHCANQHHTRHPEPSPVTIDPTSQQRTQSRIKPTPVRDLLFLLLCPLSSSTVIPNHALGTIDQTPKPNPATNQPNAGEGSAFLCALHPATRSSVSRPYFAFFFPARKWLPTPQLSSRTAPSAQSLQRPSRVQPQINRRR